MWHVRKKCRKRVEDPKREKTQRRQGAKAQSDSSSLLFSWARRPLGTGTLSLNGNAAKRRQEGRNGRKGPLGSVVRRGLLFSCPSCVPACFLRRSRSTASLRSEHVPRRAERISAGHSPFSSSENQLLRQEEKFCGDSSVPVPFSPVHEEGAADARKSSSMALASGVSLPSPMNQVSSSSAMSREPGKSSAHIAQILGSSQRLHSSPSLSERSAWCKVS